MGRVERDRELARRRHRRAKLKKLRERYLQATKPSEKAAIVEKVRKISPLLDVEKEWSAS